MAKKTSASPELEKVRHSCSHVLAQAVLDMFPEAKLGIGPAIENGFYYDFDLPRTLIPEDLPLLEKKMKHIIKQNQTFKKYEEPVDEAIKFLKQTKQDYKIELANDLKKEGENTVSFYENIDQQGNPKFVDLCGGPHVESTSKIKAFKLINFAGAYWRGSEKNKMLQRIYGICFDNKEHLDEYLKNLEEAKKRDHRKLGKELELFTIAADVGGGLPLWMPKGAIIRDELERFLKEKQVTRGYLPVYSPHIGKFDLYKTSGHWETYRESMYQPIQVEDEEFMLRPMNCPHHIHIYKTRPRSYRELPLRLAEFGTVYRNEKSGELNGLTRVRGFTVDDSHIFVTPKQLEEEFLNVVNLIEEVLKTFNFENYRVRIGMRDKEKEKYVGSDKLWKEAESHIEKAVKKVGIDYTKEPGDAAFYGPKLDFLVKDVIGREWQLGTVQVDYNLPERFDLEYIGEDGKKHRPIMIHRAPFGSLERFIGILIEHYAGAFPAWLAPVQLAIIPVAQPHLKEAQNIHDEFKKAGFRVELLDPTDTLGKRIREAELQKIPFMAVIGDKEVKDKSLTIRSYKTKKQESLKVKDFMKKLKEMVSNRHP